MTFIVIYSYFVGEIKEVSVIRLVDFPSGTEDFPYISLGVFSFLIEEKENDSVACMASVIVHVVAKQRLAEGASPCQLFQFSWYSLHACLLFCLSSFNLAHLRKRASNSSISENISIFLSSEVIIVANS